MTTTLVFTLIALLTLMIAGALYQRYATARDKKRFPPPGQFIEIGEDRIHVEVREPVTPTESPPIVCFTGIALPGITFDRIAQGLADTSKVIMYDRPGSGWSAPSDTGLDASSVSDLTARMLDKLEIHEPVILVGHSLGALYARVFIEKFPERVAGLVSIDSSHEDMQFRFPEVINLARNVMMLGHKTLRWGTYIGWSRLRKRSLTKQAYGLPEKAQAQTVALMSQTSHQEAANRESKAWEVSTAQARRVPHFGDLPVRVLVAGNWPKIMLPSWLEMQNELSHLSNCGTMKVIGDADHVGILMSEHARHSVTEIREILALLEEEKKHAAHDQPETNTETV